MSEPVDGNALAGDLREATQRELTTATGRCRQCGTVSMIAELVVYLSAPSPVARCPHCHTVVFVINRFREPVQIHWAGLELGDARDEAD